MSNAPAAPRAIVAGHGDFAAGLVSAVQLITGRGDVLMPFSAKGLSGVDLEGSLRQLVSESGLRVVFTDLQAGSCTMSARRVFRDVKDHVLIVGVNLPMLIDFVFADQMSPTDAARHAFERGRSAMSLIGPKP
jgi:mannose/fructose-specific phosphotransferase system component IIA